MPKKEFDGGAEGTQVMRTLDGHRGPRHYEGLDTGEAYHAFDARRNVHDMTTPEEGSESDRSDDMG